MTITAAPPGSRCGPLSASQTGVWFLEQAEPGGAAYHIAFALDLSGALQIASLRDALQDLVARHAALRTGFVLDDDGMPIQYVADRCEMPLQLVDVGRPPTGPEAAQAQQIAQDHATAPFDLAVPPLCRAALFRIAPGNHALHLTVHHLVADGWSISLLVEDLLALYEAQVSGREAALPALRADHLDFARCQHDTPDTSQLRSALAYWTGRLQDAPPLDLTHGRQAVASDRSGGITTLSVPATLMARVTHLARSARTTPFTVFITAYATIVAAHAGQPDVVIGVPATGRDQTAWEAVVGLLTDLTIVRADLRGNPTFRQALVRVRDSVFDGFAHPGLPFHRLVQALASQRLPHRRVVAPVLFTLENQPGPTLGHDGLTVAIREVDRGATQCDLGLSVRPDGPGYRLVLEHDLAVLDRHRAELLLRGYLALLEAATEAPDALLDELPLVSAEERRILLAVGRGPDMPLHDELCLHDVVSRTAAGAPHRVAVVSAGRRLTYLELEELSDGLAAALAAAGIRQRDRVAILLHRSWMLPVALLGVMKAGCVFVPVDVTFPRDRQQYIIEDSGARAIIGTTDLSVQFPNHRIIRMDRIDRVRPTPQVVRRRLEWSDPAYLMYTSGSTGRPKGVAVAHRSLTNHVLAMESVVRPQAGDVWLSVSSLSFDISLLEVLLPLQAGLSVIVAGDDDVVDGHALCRLVTEHTVTLMQATPLTWRLMLEAGWIGRLRIALCGGETMPPDLAGSLLGRCDEVWNVYGPTEATIWATTHRVAPDEPGSIPVGRPLGNVTIRVLNDRLQLMPLGVPGEVWIGGEAVAVGYHNRPDLTADRFRCDPFGRPDERMYRSGDLGLMRADGVLELRGRVDRQIKVRGYRIELAEIESILAGLDGIDSAVVRARPGALDARLVAYVRPCPGRVLDENDLLRNLRQILPPYMVPDNLTLVADWPRTPNGKIDLQALPAPERQARRPERAKAPSSELEHVLVTLWQELLGVSQVGVEDDFFALGGHSLLAMRLVAELNRLIDGSLAVADLLGAPTVARLARLVAKHLADPAQPSDTKSAPTRTSSAPFAGGFHPLRGTPRGARPTDPGEPTTEVPLSPDQARRLNIERQRHAQRHPPQGFNVAAAFTVQGSLDVTALNRALSALVERHEALRARFLLAEPGSWVQQIAPPRPIAIERVLSPQAGLVPEAVTEEVRREATRPFDLECGVLIRAVCWELGAGSWVLLLVCDHAVVDLTALGIILRELGERYAAQLKNKDCGSAAELGAYQRYLQQERAWLASDRASSLVRGWVEELRGNSPFWPIRLPWQATENVISNAAATIRSTLADTFVRRLSDLAATSAMANSHVMFAVAMVALAAHTEEQRIGVIVPFANREMPDADQLVADAANCLPIIVEVPREGTFAEFVVEVRAKVFHALASQRLSASEIARRISPGDVVGVPRKPYVLLTFVDGSLLPQVERLNLPGSVVAPFSIGAAVASAPLTIRMYRSTMSLEITLTYACELLDQDVATGLSQFLVTTAERAIENPEIRLEALLDRT